MAAAHRVPRAATARTVEGVGAIIARWRGVGNSMSAAGTEKSLQGRI